MMHGREKSDLAIVAIRTNADGIRRGKPANKAGRPAAEQGEPRAGAEGNASQQSARRTQSRESVSQALERIRQATSASPSNTRGGSRMRESRTYGSVRGARSNARPYRDRPLQEATAPRASQKRRLLVAGAQPRAACSCKRAWVCLAWALDWR